MAIRQQLRTSIYNLLLHIEKNNLAPNTIYTSASKIKPTYDVSVETLRRWAASRRGDDQLARGLQFTQKAKICYRVSSEHRQGDLERQIADLQQHFPEHEIVSGLNWKR